MGDALLQKTYTTDFLTKKRIRNNGTVPQYYVEDDHEAIIPKEIFMQVQEELVRRRIVHTSPNGKNRVFSSSHCLSNIVFCGCCGEFYRRIHWYNRGKKSIVWRCISRCDKDTFLITLQKNIETVLESEKGQPLTNVDKRLAELQEELLKRTSARTDYEDVAEEIYRLREEKQKLQLEGAGRDEQKKRIADMSTFLREQPTALTQYDEPLVRRLIEKVTIYEDKFTVEFKSGVTVDVDE
jgi:site-specific DNA recombinase